MTPLSALRFHAFCAPTEALKSSLVLEPIAPAQLATAVDELDATVRALETLCAAPSMRAPNPARFRVLTAFVRSMAAAGEYLAALADAEPDTLPELKRQQLDDVTDRIDEALDTLRWATEAADELAELIKRETCES